MSEEEKSKTEKKNVTKKTTPKVAPVRTVHVKNVSQDYETLTIDGEEQILYPNNTLDIKTAKPEKMKSYLTSEYGDSLKITIK